MGRASRPARRGTGPRGEGAGDRGRAQRCEACRRRLRLVVRGRSSCVCGYDLEHAGGAEAALCSSAGLPIVCDRGAQLPCAIKLVFAKVVMRVRRLRRQRAEREKRHRAFAPDQPGTCWPVEHLVELLDQHRPLRSSASLCPTVDRLVAQRSRRPRRPRRRPAGGLRIPKRCNTAQECGLAHKSPRRRAWQPQARPRSPASLAAPDRSRAGAEAWPHPTFAALSCSPTRLTRSPAAAAACAG